MCQVPAAIGDDRVLLRMRKVPPLFSVDIWNVYDITLKGGHRTNNSCGAWNHGFHQMIGHDHPSIWGAIEPLKKDQAHVATQLLQAARGQPPKKRGRRATVDLQNRLQQLSHEFSEGEKTIEEFLKGVGHNIRFHFFFKF